MICEKVPDLILMSDYEGNYEKYLAATYDVFEKHLLIKHFIIIQRLLFIKSFQSIRESLEPFGI